MMSQKCGKPLAKRRCGSDIGSCQSKVNDGKNRTNTVNKKVRSAWTEAATDTFFEGLYRHGKEFEKIYNFMTTKYRKMTDPLIATLTHSQVRFYYYQMWKKVSDYLLAAQSHVSCDETHVVASEPKDTMCGETNTEEQELDIDNLISTRPADSTVSDDEVLGFTAMDKGEPSNTGKKREKDFLKESVSINGRKYPLDLVALICYGKHRRYLRGVKSKVELGNILSSLVHNGTVQMDFRGRNRKKVRLNLKLPNVRALKGKEVSESSPLSCHTEACSAVIELLPASSDAWCYVQGIAQNPRLQVTAPWHFKFEALKVFLEKKWKVPHYMQIMFSLNPSGLTQDQAEECSLECLISDVAVEGNSKPIAVTYDILYNSPEGPSVERCSSSHKCLATLLKIGQFLEPATVDHKQDELDFDDISHHISHQESPTSQPYKNLSTLSHSPFRKLTHLKNSCYSSPARRKLKMTSPRMVKRSSNVHTESCNPASGVNFVTFKKTDMAGESFSTLQMRHILDGVQQQMSDKTTTFTKLSDGSVKLGGKRSALNTDSFKTANIPGTESGSSQLVSDNLPPKTSKTSTNPCISESSGDIRQPSHSVQRALQEVRGLSKRKRGKMAQGTKGAQNLLPRPYQTSALSSALGVGLSLSNNGSKSVLADSGVASTLLLQNVIEQLKVKLLIQALQKQQRQVISDQFSTQALPPQLHLPEKQGILSSGTISPLPPVSVSELHLTESPYMPTCDTLPLHSDCSTDVFQSGSNTMSKPLFGQESSSLKLSQFQPAEHNTELTEPLTLNSDVMLPSGSSFLPTKCGLSLNDHQDASNASFTDLLQGLSDSVDNSLMGMLHHLKSVSPAKEYKKDGVAAAENSDLSFESLMALLESPKKSSTDGNCVSVDAPDRGSSCKLPPVELQDEDTIDFIKNFQYLSGKNSDTF